MRRNIAVIVLASLCGFAAAEDAPDGGKILVTATRTERLAQDAPGSVTVIGSGRLSEEAGADISAVVGSAEGVRAQSYGGPGSVMSFGIRGAFGPHSLVLVDGRTLNAPSLGMADVAGLSPAFLERVEVVRGPVSALYGAGAVGGVVQLVTRNVPDEPVSESLIAVGSFGTVRATVLQGAAQGEGGALFGIDAFRTDGHRPNSFLEATELFGKVGYGLADASGRTVVSFGLRDSRNGIPGVKPDEDPLNRSSTQIAFGDDEVSSLVDRDSAQSGYLQAEYTLRDFRARVSMIARKEQPRQEWLDYTTSDHIVQSSEFETLRPEAEALNVWRIGGGRLLLGASVAHDKFDAKTVEENLDAPSESTTGRRDYRTTASGFGQVELGEGAWQGLAGIRWDEPSDYDGGATGRVIGSWRNAGGLRLEAGIGTAFRAPSLNDLNWPADMWSAGNPDLVPEKSVEGEASARWNASGPDGAAVSAAVFQKRIDDMIRWFPDSMGVYRPENLDQVDITGLEVGGELPLGRAFRARLAYTMMEASETGPRLVHVDYMQATPETYETIERELANVPTHQVALDLDWNLRSAGRGLKVGVSASWTSAVIQYYETWNEVVLFTEYDVTYPTKTLDAGFLLGLRAGWAWDRGEVFAKVDNLLDRDYAVQFGNTLTDGDYPMPGRTVTIGARLDF